MEIMYDQVNEFIGHKFRKSLIEMEYGITPKLSTLGNPTSNAILEQIHQVLGSLVRTCNIAQTYVDKYEQWLVILAAAEFSIRSITNMLKGYSPGQLLFGRDMITPIKNKVDWELIHHKK